MSRPMSQETAKKRIKSFIRKYKGKTVLFMGLSEQEKHTYVMVKSFNFFRFLETKEALNRAINNANAQKRDGYASFDCISEKMRIGE